MSDKSQWNEQEEALARWGELAQRSQQAVQAFFKRQSDTGGFQLVDQQSLSEAFGDLMLQLAKDPSRLFQAQMQLWEKNLELWQAMGKRMMGEEAAPVAAPGKSDRRFKDKAWDEALLFDYLKQSYLLTANCIQSLVHETEGLDRKTKEKVDFFTRQYLSAMAPSNFAATNPAVFKKTMDSKGENLIHGLEHMLEDLEAGKGRLKISMTDEASFAVGKNVAASPGKVIYRNDLIELIQYAPTTETVHKRPLLFVPPWINKFYVFDLQPKNSLIKGAIDQGHTVFVISWVNPRKELAHKDFEDYMREGPLAALDVIEEQTGERDVNLLGFCIGGILSVATLAYMAAKGDKRVNSATFLATMVDFDNVGEVSVFIDDKQLASLEKHVAEKGYLEGHHMAEMFNMMRENDLIWSFVVNNYLMGREPMPFDLLYWNSDSTRLPATMLATYIRKFYMDNGLMKPGHLVLDGVPIDIGKIETPSYFLCTKEDHIAPWVSGYPVVKAFSGPVKFVLGGSGHIAGVINPPSANKYCYWTSRKTPDDPEAWLAGAERHEGSWWSDWHRWLGRKGGPKVPARDPAAGPLPPLCDAPGTYVLERVDD